MKRLLIIGAGDFGREVLSWATHVQASQREWTITGFLDTDPAALAGKNVRVGVLGSPNDYVLSDGDVFVNAISCPEAKLRICESLAERGGCFINFLHPSVIVGSDCDLGYGNVLCPNVVLSNNVVLGRFISINVASSIGHDTKIGDGCTISSHCDVMGFASLGRCCFLGSHAAVLPSRSVGNYSKIGACSAVIRNVAPRTTVMGVPAQVITRAEHPKV